jgi:hypothetical protein
MNAETGEEPMNSSKQVRNGRRGRWAGAVGVNCGGPAADGLAADQPYRKGSWGYVGGSDINDADCSNAPGVPAHLRTYRASAGTFEYRFDVPRGVYNVRLHFAEPLFTRVGDRRFNVWINGETRLLDYDIFAEAGARHKAIQREFDGITVHSGEPLVLRFGALRGPRQTALVQAIEVRQDKKAKPVAAPAPDPAVRIQSLDGQWQIAKDPGWEPGKDPDEVGLGRAEKWYTPDGFPLPASRPIQVPGHIWEAWSSKPEGGVEIGVYWYGRAFVAAMPKAADTRYFLRFGCCQYACEVWLNGERVGSHVGASAPFELDVTRPLRLGENFIAVRVFSPECGVQSGSSGYAVPSSSGGLMRSVTLQARPLLRIEDVFARPDWKNGNLPLEITLDNHAGAAAEVTLTAVVTERQSGRAVASVTAGVHAPPERSVHALATTVTPVRLWSPDDPFLYAVTVTADWAKKRDTYEIPRLGFRELRVDNGAFLFNGKRFYPKCTHGGPLDEAVGWVTERTPEALVPDFFVLRNAGFNMYRPFAHAAYPYQLDQADEMGFLIYGEHPGTCFPVGPERFAVDLPDMLRRDRNRPSVVIWGLLNERRNDHPVVEAAIALLPTLRKVDDTRLIILNSGGGSDWLRAPHVDNGAWMSNPGSSGWDARMTDYHWYPGYPQPWGEEGRDLANQGIKEGFCSEGGIGSSYDPYVSRRRLRRLGVARDAGMSAFVDGAIQWVESVWTRYGLSDTYPDPAAMFADSVRLEAREREMFFNFLRADPRVTGYSLTSLISAGGNGEGILDSALELKTDLLPVLQAGWARLGWTLLVNPRHAYADQPLHVKIGMFNEDCLAPGAYPARFAISGPNGEVWRKETIVTVPSGDHAPLSFAVFEEDVQVTGLVEGRHTLTTTLLGATNAAGGRLDFSVTQREKHADLAQTTITVLGLEQKVKDLLTSRGATLREFQAGQTFDREAILVGPETDAATWRAVYRHVARGAHAILLSVTDPRWFALQQDKGEYRRAVAWLYRHEIIARNHPVFRDMPTQVLMPDYYGQLLEGSYFRGIAVPDETVVVRLYCTFSCPGAPRFEEFGTDGVTVGTYRHHAGRFTVNAFNLVGHLGMPAADRMLVNLAAHASATAVPVQPLPEQYDEELDKLGIQ